MKKPLHIKVNEEGRTMAYSIKKEDIPNCDFCISDYPDDYVGMEFKYFIKLDENKEPYFEENPNWQAELEAMLETTEII